jgi:hypothetical protein
VVTEQAEIVVGRDAAVLRPLDLDREVGRGPEAVGPAQGVPDVPQRKRFRGEDALRRLRSEEAQLPERRRVERRAAYARHSELVEPPAHLARSLVRERHRKDLVGPKSPALDLLCDTMRDRRRLSGACPGEDANGPADGVDRTLLLGVQHRATLVGREDGASYAVASNATLLGSWRSATP